MRSPKMRNKLSRRKNAARPTTLDESLEDFAEPVVKKSSQRSASTKSQPESTSAPPEKVSQDKPDKKTSVSKLVSNVAVDGTEVFKEVTNVVKKADESTKDPSSGSVSSMANCPFCGKEFKSSSEVRSGY